MGNINQKIDKKLAVRQADYDQYYSGNPAFKRPGSRNTHKQYSGIIRGTRKR